MNDKSSTYSKDGKKYSIEEYKTETIINRQSELSITKRSKLNKDI